MSEAKRCQPRDLLSARSIQLRLKIFIFLPSRGDIEATRPPERSEEKSRRSLYPGWISPERVGKELRNQPRSGARMQPRAQALGEKAGSEQASKGRKTSYDTGFEGTTDSSPAL